MAHTISIKFEAPVPAAENVTPICRLFQQQPCAADFMGESCYNSNVDEDGRKCLATRYEDYIKQQVAHPGLVAALKKAVRDDGYVIADADEKAALYAEELAPALKDQGFTIVVDPVEAEEGQENVEDNTEGTENGTNEDDTEGTENGTDGQ